MHLRWLADAGGIHGLAGAADDFLRLSNAAKTFILKAARAVNNKKSFDAAPLFDEMAGAWDTGMATLDQRVGGQPAGAAR